MKRHKAAMIVCIVLACIVLFMVVINAIPPKKNVEHNPFVLQEGEKPMIAAHRGGGLVNPENTMLAFRDAVDTYEVDIIESDVYLTADGYLVYNHDSYIDETCDINGDLSLARVKAMCKDESRRHYIRDMTLEELEQYNFGYYFEDKNGERIYSDVSDPAAMGLQIATVDKLFEEFHLTHPDLLFIIEIKNGGDDGREACRIMNEELDKYPMFRDNIVIGTFHDEVEKELRENYPDLYRGASVGVARDFVLTQLFGVNIFNSGDFACLQVPTSYDIGIEVPLDLRTLVRRAHRRNIAVQYWTINDGDDMRRLISLGCDCIMTDDPELMRRVLEDMGK